MIPALTETPREMVPLRVTAHMTEPVIYYGDGLHLDGPLAYGAYQRLPAEAKAALPPLAMSAWADDLELPLARWSYDQPGEVHHRLRDSDGRVWGWRASAVHADWLLRGRMEVRKRPPVEGFVRSSRDPKVAVNKGHHKGWDLPFPTRFAHRLVWYAVGDIEGVRACLSWVHNIGKKSHHGNGRVGRWEVEEWPHDWSTHREGELTRRLPHVALPSAPAARGTIRAPYHHPSRACPSVEPDWATLLPGSDT